MYTDVILLLILYIVNNLFVARIIILHIITKEHLPGILKT